MLQIWLEELTQHIQGTIDGKLLERIQSALIQLGVSKLAGFIDFIQFAGDLSKIYQVKIILENYLVMNIYLNVNW